MRPTTQTEREILSESIRILEDLGYLDAAGFTAMALRALQIDAESVPNMVHPIADLEHFDARGERQAIHGTCTCRGDTWPMNNNTCWQCELCGEIYPSERQAMQEGQS
jgi:hypothetical protein